MLITMLVIAIILSAVGINMIREQKEEEARRERRKKIEENMRRLEQMGKRRD
jgi:hypothetical protein|nr:MAG TPA: protein of unknown function (DUF4083) [Caudoviricetes sp.]